MMVTKMTVILTLMIMVTMKVITITCPLFSVKIFWNGRGERVSAILLPPAKACFTDLDGGRLFDWLIK